MGIHKYEDAGKGKVKTKTKKIMSAAHFVGNGATRYC